MKKYLIVLGAFLFSISSFAIASPTTDNTPKIQLAANMPPGLQKKGFTPKGLENKTPAGWSKGTKRGWDRVWDKDDKRWHWKQKHGKQKHGKRIKRFD